MEDRLDASIDGLRIVDGAMINPPAAMVSLTQDGIEYHRVLQDGMAEWDFNVIVYVSTSYLRSSRDLCDDFLDTTGPKSVKQALEDEPTLGGLVDDLVVTNGVQEDVLVRTEPNTGMQFLVARLYGTVYAA